MSSETEKTETASAPVAEAPPAEPVKQEQATPVAKAEGATFVDLDGLPIPDEAKQALRARFSHFTKALKDKDAALHELRRHNEELDKKITSVSERVVEHDKDRIAQAKASLKAQIKAARDEADFDKEFELTEKLNSLAEPKPEQKKEEKPNHADMNWESRPELRSFATELADDGSLRRPWILPTHQDHSKAAGVAFSIAEQWKAEGRSFGIDDMLRELDTRMSAPKPKAPPAVLPTAKTAAPASKKIELTPDQLRVAQRMGIAPEKYAAQLRA